jgi:hypothetical protein
MVSNTVHAFAVGFLHVAVLDRLRSLSYSGDVFEPAEQSMTPLRWLAHKSLSRCFRDPLLMEGNTVDQHTDPGQRQGARPRNLRNSKPLMRESMYLHLTPDGGQENACRNGVNRVENST